MNNDLKKIFDKIFYTHLPESGFSIDDFFIESFIINFSFEFSLSALDANNISECILESNYFSIEHDLQKSFMKSLKLQKINSVIEYEKAISMCLNHVVGVTNIIQYIIDTNRIF